MKNLNIMVVHQSLGEVMGGGGGGGGKKKQGGRKVFLRESRVGGSWGGGLIPQCTDDFILVHAVT